MGQRLWTWLKMIPVGAWAALVAAVTVFGLYMRVRKLGAELELERLKSAGARAKANAARHTGRSEVYREKMLVHERRVAVLEGDRAKISRIEDETLKRVASLPPDEVTQHYLDLVKKVPEP